MYFLKGLHHLEQLWGKPHCPKCQQAQIIYQLCLPCATALGFETATPHGWQRAAC
jgi:hypothetical protein